LIPVASPSADAMFDRYKPCQKGVIAPANPALLMATAATGWGQEKDRELARRAGFDHHLVKPVEIERVRRILEASDSAL